MDRVEAHLSRERPETQSEHAKCRHPVCKGAGPVLEGGHESKYHVREGCTASSLGSRDMLGHTRVAWLCENILVRYIELFCRADIIGRLQVVLEY
jgi:hypothetical protein